MAEIVLLDKIFNGYRINYSFSIYKHDVITKYIKDELLKTLKSNNLYNLIPSVYELKFIIYKTRDSDSIIYAESLNEYTDYQEKYNESLDEIIELKKTIDTKNDVIRCLKSNINMDKENIIQENKDFRDSLYTQHVEQTFVLKENNKLRDENNYLKERIKELENKLINQKTLLNNIYY